MGRLKNLRDFATPAAWRNRGAVIFKLFFPGLKPGAIQKHRLYGQTLNSEQTSPYPFTALHSFSLLFAV
jgi:hypothetical protein